MVDSILAQKLTLWEKFASPKRIAFALISIASHNMVSLGVLSILMGVDLILHIYLVIVQILKQIPTVNADVLS